MTLQYLKYFMISVFRDGTEENRYNGNTGGTIPPSIDTAIKQGLFTAEGGIQNDPVIIGRTIQDKSEFYAVISTIVQENDKDLYLYLYLFDVRPNNQYKNLCNLSAWLSEQNRIPVWGDSLENQEIPDISEYIDSSETNHNFPRIEVRKESFHESLKEINSRISRIYLPKPSDQNIDSIAWAFNVTSLEKPEQFQYIFAANQPSCASIAAQQLQANGTNNSAIATTTPTKDLLANKPKGRYSLGIHEFSTGIHADGNYSDWVSQGFSGTYMNVTIDPIPNIVEIAIANGLFQTVGGLPHQPAIIGRVLQGGNEQWSVVAVVTIGKDDKGRSLSAFRYFIAKGVQSISGIVAWIETEKRKGKLPIFNPFDKKRLEDFHTVDIEILEPMQLEEADLNWLNDSSSSVTKATPQLSLWDIDNLAYAKSQLNKKPISWAYNIYSLKSPNRFQVIHPVNEASRNTILTALSGNQQQPKALPASDVRLDPRVLLKNLVGQSIPSDDLVEDLIDQIQDTPTFGNVTAKNYWEEVFQSFDAVIILNNRLYSPQNVRLLTWRAIVFPETLPEFVNWICVEDNNQINKNQSNFEDLEGQLGRYFDYVRGNPIEENLILGIIELLIDLFNQKKDEDSANPKSVANVAWLLETNKVNSSPSLWSSLKDKVITAFAEKVLVSAARGTPSGQVWQEFIQPLITENATVNRITLAQPAGWRDFYVGIRDYTSKKQNNPKYVYIAELFEQLGSGQKKSLLSRAKDFILGVSQLLIFIITIILVIIFDGSFATNIPKESWFVSMFAPLAGLASVSLITRSFISAWLVGIPHIIFIRWRLCLDNIPHGWMTAVLWTILILFIWLIYDVVQSFKKSKAINRDYYALAAVFYTISYGIVSQNVFDNAVKSGYEINPKVQGFSIASAKTIDDSLIRFVKKIQLQGVIIALTIVAVIFALVLGTHTLFEANKWNSPFVSIFSDNPNCGFQPQPGIDYWETTKKETQSIVNENIQGSNKGKVIEALLDILGGESLVGNETEKGKYFYKGAIEEARQDSKLIQIWTDLISKYQTSKQKDDSDIIPSGYIRQGDRTSELIRQELKMLVDGRANFETTRQEIKKLVDEKTNKYKNKNIVIQGLISVLDSRINMTDLSYDEVIDKAAKLQVQQDRWIRLIYNYENRLSVLRPTGFITPIANGGTTINKLSSELEDMLDSKKDDITDAAIERMLIDVLQNAFPVATYAEKDRDTIVKAFEQELGVSSLQYPTNPSDIDVWRQSIKDYFDRLRKAGKTSEANLKDLTKKVTDRARPSR